MNTSVYLVSYGGLLVKNNNTKTASLTLYLRLICVKKK